MLQSEPFIHAVNDSDFPEYKKYIIQPMNLTLLEKNIQENVYGSTQAFEADAKWILHNSIVFNSCEHAFSVALSVVNFLWNNMNLFYVLHRLGIVIKIRWKLFEW